MAVDDRHCLSEVTGFITVHTWAGPEGIGEDLLLLILDMHVYICLHIDK